MDILAVVEPVVSKTLISELEFLALQIQAVEAAVVVEIQLYFGAVVVELQEVISNKSYYHQLLHIVMLLELQVQKAISEHQGLMVGPVEAV
jgi:hypothetical protein